MEKIKINLLPIEFTKLEIEQSKFKKIQLICFIIVLILAIIAVAIFVARFLQSKEITNNEIILKEKQQLPAIFSKQYTRTIQNDFTISFNNQWYQLTNDQSVTVSKQDRVTIEERLDGTVKIRLRGKYLNYRTIPKRIPKKEYPWVLAAVANH